MRYDEIISNQSYNIIKNCRLIITLKNMRIILNKDQKIIPDNISVLDLLQYFKIELKYMAVEVNESIIPKSEYSNFNLKENDKVEIINAVGGG